MTTTSLQVLDAEFERAERLRAAWQLDAAEDAYRALLSDATLRPRLLTEIAVTLRVSRATVYRALDDSRAERT